MSKLSVKVWALPGFLGLKSDFDCMAGCEVVKIGTASSMQAWAKEFNSQVATYGAERNILVGYSMGGRLGLHAMQDRPELWEQGLFISSHPGLDEGHKERLIADERWAERFEKEGWESLQAAWNGQNVFDASNQPRRHEHDYCRNELAAQLRNFSLGHQNVSLPQNATWVVGEYDSKFRQLLPQARVIPQSGHRVIFDNPQALKKLIWEICNSR